MSCTGCCPANLLKSDVEKWTNDIFQLMANENGRDRFIKYLEDRDLNESLTTVGFVCECDELIQQIDNERSRRQHVLRSTLQRSLRNLVDTAKEIDFYENEIEKLEEILEEEDTVKICKTLKKAKGRALNMLEYEHREFSKYIIKEFQSACK